MRHVDGTAFDGDLEAVYRRKLLFTAFVMGKLPVAQLGKVADWLQGTKRVLQMISMDARALHE